MGMNDWESIDTAPKDGTRILAYPVEVYGYVKPAKGYVLQAETSYEVGVVAFEYGKWICSPNEATEYDPDAQPVRWWRPLPEVPEVIDPPRALDSELAW